MSFDIVSDLRAEWWADHAVPWLSARLIQTSPPGLLWLVVDTPAEGDLLIRRTLNWASDVGISNSAVELPTEDPFLMWEILHGTGEELGMLAKYPQPKLIGLLRTCLIPSGSLADRLTWLGALASASGTCLLLAICHADLPVYREQVNSSDCLEIPEFRHSPMRLNVIQADVEAAFPSHSSELQDTFSRVILELDPTSRTEVQTWLENWVASSDAETFAQNCPPNTWPRMATQADSVPSRNELATWLTSGDTAFAAAADAFRTWKGVPLAHEIYQPPQPFLSPDSGYWFTCLVSYLSCLLFDGVDSRLEFLWRYQVDDQTGKVIAKGRNPFCERLRLLRTLLQHGLKVRSTDDSQKREAVLSWYDGVCGVTDPQRHHWRKLTHALLIDWLQTAQGLRHLIEYLPNATNLAEFESQLALQQRSLPDHEWDGLLGAATDRINPTLDWKEVKRLRITDLKSTLQDSAAAAANLYDEARRLAEDAVASLSAVCPLTGDRLKAAGLQPGRQFGQILSAAKKIWEANKHLEADELLQIVMKDMEVIGG